MAEFGTPAFKELWRQKGFFAALDSSPRHGKSTAESFRAMNSNMMREKIPLIRKELARLGAVIDRLNHHTMAGSNGGKVENLHLERDIVELGGWIASLMAAYGGMTYYLSEAGHQKVYGWMKEQAYEDSTHPSRLE